MSANEVGSDVSSGRCDVLRLKEVSQSYAGTPVLTSLDFSLAAGEYCVVLGRSGGGKSTLLRLIAGLIPCDSGAIEINQTCVRKVSPRDRDVALMFQDDRLYPHWTIRKTLALACRQGPAEARSSGDLLALAERFEITDTLDRRPDQVSGGQLRRAALAKALLRRPAIMLLDEPLHGLDASLREELIGLLGDLPRERGLSVDGHPLRPTALIHVTHDGEEAMRLADRIAVLDRGEFADSGSPQEIYDRPRTLAVARSLGNPPTNVLSSSFIEALPAKVRKVMALPKTQSPPEIQSPPETQSPPKTQDIAGEWILRPESIEISRDARGNLDGSFEWRAEFVRSCYVNGHWLSHWRSHQQDWSVTSSADPMQFVRHFGHRPSATLSMKLDRLWQVSNPNSRPLSRSSFR